MVRAESTLAITQNGVAISGRAVFPVPCLLFPCTLDQRVTQQEPMLLFSIMLLAEAFIPLFFFRYKQAQSGRAVPVLPCMVVLSLYIHCETVKIRSARLRELTVGNTQTKAMSPTWTEVLRGSLV